MRPQKTDLPFSHRTEKSPLKTLDGRTAVYVRHAPRTFLCTRGPRNRTETRPPPAPPARRWNVCIGATEREGARGGVEFCLELPPATWCTCGGALATSPWGHGVLDSPKSVASSHWRTLLTPRGQSGPSITCGVRVG